MLSLLLAGTMFAVDVLPDMGVWGDYLGEAYIGTTSSSEPPESFTTRSQRERPQCSRGSDISAGSWSTANR